MSVGHTERPKGVVEGDTSVLVPRLLRASGAGPRTAVVRVDVQVDADPVCLDVSSGRVGDEDSIAGTEVGHANNRRGGEQSILCTWSCSGYLCFRRRLWLSRWHKHGRIPVEAHGKHWRYVQILAILDNLLEAV
jgi:hypothetical protein